MKIVMVPSSNVSSYCVTEAACRVGRVKTEVLLSLCVLTRVCILGCQELASLSAG